MKTPTPPLVLEKKRHLEKSEVKNGDQQEDLKVEFMRDLQGVLEKHDLKGLSIARLSLTADRSEENCEYVCEIYRGQLVCKRVCT